MLCFFRTVRNHTHSMAERSVKSSIKWDDAGSLNLLSSYIALEGRLQGSCRCSADRIRTPVPAVLHAANRPDSTWNTSSSSKVELPHYGIQVSRSLACHLRTSLNAYQTVTKIGTSEHEWSDRAAGDMWTGAEHCKVALGINDTSCWSTVPLCCPHGPHSK